MLIEELSGGEIKKIFAQDLGTRKNAYIFLETLNHLDPFIHEQPVWQSSIWTAYQSSMMKDFTNASSATA